VELVEPLTFSSNLPSRRIELRRERVMTSRGMSSVASGAADDAAEQVHHPRWPVP
jgi:hypothetical protein